jgi:hypothetical protein
MRFGWAIVALVLLVGLAGTAVALHSREADSQLVSRQQSLSPVGSEELARLLLTTSDPRPAYVHAHTHARAARCRSRAPSALGNPWTCVVTYAHPPSVLYRVTVYADRSIYGRGASLGGPPQGVLSVKGCCVALAGP